MSATATAQPPETATTTLIHGERLSVYTIRDDNRGTPRDRSFWTSIGGAWVNRDGSINVRLDALPTNGKLHIRRPNKAADNQEVPEESAANSEAA